MAFRNPPRCHCLGRTAFHVPFLDFAVLAHRFQIHLNMRIEKFDPGDRAGERHRFLDVEFRCKRMVSEDR